MQDGQTPSEDWRQPHASSAYVPPAASDPVISETFEAASEPVTSYDTADSPNPDDEAVLRWQAQEYIEQDRSMSWFIIAGVVALVLVAIAIFWLHSITFALLVPIMAVALFVYVRRPPEMLNYTLSRKGLHVNDKLYTFDQFKSFGILDRQGHYTLVLVPRKRLNISQTVTFPQEVGEKLVDFLAARLPMKEVKLDFVDKLLSRIRL